MHIKFFLSIPNAVQPPFLRRDCALFQFLERLQLFRGATTQLSALTTCMEHGGFPVSIHSEAQNQALLSFLAEETANDGADESPITEVWTGATDETGQVGNRARVVRRTLKGTSGWIVTDDTVE